MEVDEPLSAIDLAILRSQTNNSSTNRPKRPSTVRRGRPPKRPREEYNVSSTSESEGDEATVSATQSSGDDNDPDWSKDQDDDKPRRPRGKVNYNVKSLFQAELQRAGTKKPRGRPRGSYKNVATPRLGQVVIDDSEKKELDFFIEKVPDHTADLPSEEARHYGAQVDLTDAVKKSSGGFRHFIRALPDASIIEIFSYVNARYNFPEKTDDALQIVQCLRHMWNKLPFTIRLIWERAARAKAKENYKNGITQDEDPPEAEDLGVLMQKIQGTDETSKDPYPRMPLNELPYKSAARLDNNIIFPSCCPNEKRPMKNFQDARKHYLMKHYSAHFYACQFCNVLHEHKEHLLEHNCKEFSDFMVNRLMAGVVEEPSMKCAYLFIFCFECGYWLPIRESYKGDRLEQAWNFFCTVNRYHCGKNLNVVIVYTIEPIREGRNDYFHAKFMPNIVKNLPVTCTKCKIDFTTLTEMNEHMLQHVEHKCTKCAAKFGTEAHLKFHMISHMQNKILFARYCKDVLTVYPPIHVKHGLPRIGFANSKGPAYGGKCQNGDDNLFEFVDSSEIFEDEKINNAMHAPSQNLGDGQGFAEKQARHDMGLEEAKQYDKHPNPEQTELIEKLNGVFTKQMTEKKHLKWNAHIWDASGLKKNCFYDGEKEDKTKEGKLVDGKAMQLVCTGGSPLVNEIANSFVVKVSLPTLACFDALSQGRLDKSYDYCEDCHVIYSNDCDFQHECPKEKIFRIHRIEDGIGSRVKCHLCEERFCSIFALRGHYAIDHCRCVDLKEKEDKDKTSGSSLLKIAMKRMLKGARSLVARQTDANLSMEESQGFLRPKVQTSKALPAGGIYPNGRRSAYENRVFPVGPRRPINNLSNTPKSSIPLMKPYTQDATRTMMMCLFCQFRCQDMKKLREHLRTHHTIICRGCGQAFATPAAIGHHESQCVKQFSKVSMGSIQGTCVACRRIEPLPRLYTHIFEAHLNNIGYGQDDERIYRLDSNWLFVKDIYAPSLHGQTPLPVKVLPTQAIRQTFSCYLCGFEFSSPEQLKAHLDRHPESFTCCPFCPGHAIRSHEEFKQHLYQRHYDHLESSMVCKTCQQVIERGNISHVLYQCLLTKRCAFCEDHNEDMQAEKLRAHWKTEHPKLFNRFRCSECKLAFPQLQACKLHTCKVFDMDHKCGCGKITASRSAFVDHFWEHVNHNNQSCRLCGFEFNQGGPDQQSIGVHRLKHVVTVGKSSNRQIKIMDEDLLPGKKQTQESQPSTPRTQGVIEVVLDDDEPGPPVSRSPSHEVDSNEKTILLIVKQLLKDVCIKMGEDFREEANVEDTLTANVRTEAEDIQVVSHHPGYVDDDMDMDPSTPVSSGPIVRVINEPGDDDELVIVAEVEHSKSSSASSVASNREKTHKCPQCSHSFITKGSLMNHIISSHRNDVGGIYEKVYGVPTSGLHYLCRSCCALFENSTQYRKHISSHGPNTGISCPLCSGISYNQPLYEQHRLSHAKQGRARMSFSCGTCSISFCSDLRLYNHLNIQHQISLMFFCKSCSLATMNLSVILDHIQRTQICKLEMIKKGFRYDQMMGVFPANLVHYQPSNQIDFEQRIQMGLISCVKPSDCVHRSFLTMTDSVISCRECHCTMAATTFHANEDVRVGGSARDRIFYDDPSTDHPWMREIEQVYGYKKTSTHYQSNSVTKTILPKSMQNAGRLAVLDPYAKTPINNSNYLKRSILPKTIVATVQKPATETVAVPVNGAVIRGGFTIKPVASVHPSTREETSPPTLPPNTRINLSSSGRATCSPSSTASSSNDTSSLNPPKSKCNLCGNDMATSKVRRLHELHKNGQDWFCLICAVGQKTEIDAVSHAFNCSMTDAKKEKLALMENFRPMVFSLQCPFDSCKGQEGLVNIATYKNHLATVHSSELPHIASCGQRFANTAALAKHEKEHARFDELGIATTCCSLCGIANQWNLTTEIHGHQTIISHLAAHGLCHYPMCRGCFTCFPNDFDFSKTMRHFESSHTCPNGHGLTKCLICSISLRKDQVHSHIQEKHIVRGYKPRRTPNHQLHVKTSGVSRLFMGLSVEGYTDEDIKKISSQTTDA